MNEVDDSTGAEISITTKSRHSRDRDLRESPQDHQIAFAPKQAELGITVAEVCRKMDISDAKFYKWRDKYAGVGPSELRRLRQLEEENRKLKQIVADLSATRRH